jgi:Fur family transcriptional regulator, ferric uptake regulator
MTTPTTTSTLDRQVERRLRERDIRYTLGRRRVIGALAGSDGPRSAAELGEELGSAVPLSSIYRSLSVLEEAGVLVPHNAVRGLTRYELAEWITGHHHHLVCLVCGLVEDIEIPDRLEGQLQTIVDDIGSSTSFRQSNHALEIEGRCSRCV